jgi:predicted transposase YbfD/YdcC
MLKNIRSHWAIENSLHWILDMSFSDDQSRIRKENAPYAIAIMRHIALNVLQLAKQERQSIKGLRKICGWNNSILDLVIS